MRLFLIFCSRLNQTSVQHLWWNFFQKHSIIDVWQNLKNDSFRSSHQMRSIKKGVLRNFGKFTGQHMCQCLFLNKADFVKIKKRLWHGCFLVNFPKFLRRYFLQNTSGRLLLPLWFDCYWTQPVSICTCGFVAPPAVSSWSCNSSTWLSRSFWAWAVFCRSFRSFSNSSSNSSMRAISSWILRWNCLIWLSCPSLISSSSLIALSRLNTKNRVLKEAVTYEFFLKSSSKKFGKIHRKILVPESLF